MNWVNAVLLFLFGSYKVIIICPMYEGDFCNNSNKNGEESGRCEPIKECPWAIAQIRQYSRIDLCSFNDKIPIICCPFNQINSNIFKNNTIIQKRSADEIFGAISIAKCQEISKESISYIFAGSGGKRTLLQEFPHMALLGYAFENEIRWGCGGSLISFEHILSAAHCLSSNSFGVVKHVRLGAIELKKREYNDDEKQDFTISEAIPHPNFDRVTFKNDIGIIKLNKKIRLTSHVKPACLYIEHNNENYLDKILTATGWGITELGGEPSNHLMKVELKILDNAECKKQYIQSGRKGNIDGQSQLCAASADSTKIMDTCQGDSGGPLQISNNSRFRTDSSIIGVTSFGKSCGLTKSAGIYTRVSNYVPWIESIVWKNKN